MTRTTIVPPTAQRADGDGVVLTPHPLQRIGAYALASLAKVGSPAEISGDSLTAVARKMADDAAEAAGTDSKQPEGFWLKCSFSFFPNAPMNHPGNAKKSRADVVAAVRRWREKPDQEQAPGVPCVLCGRPAARYYGKVDVPLAESDIYRNTTPRGHEGVALCWPCVCCFHALPYGCLLTGGPAVAIHSWDENFLGWSVDQRVERNRQEILIGRGIPRQPPSREVLALQLLREYADELTSGIELLVFSNNNRGQALDIHSMDQPLAEWLRTTIRGTDQRVGFAALLRTHQTKDRSGIVSLARSAFRDPGRVVSPSGRYLAEWAVHGVLPSTTPQLSTLCYSYVDKVMSMDQGTLAEIRATAGRVGLLLSQQTAGQFNKFYADYKQPGRLRAWLRRQAIDWALRPPKGETGPLLTTRGYELLFDPTMDSRAWFHREIFLIAVLEKLHELGWHPNDADQAAKDLAESDEDVAEQTELLDGEGA